MFSRHTTQQLKQAIAFMLGCVVPGASWTPSLSPIANAGCVVPGASWTPSLSPIANAINERGYNDTARRVLEEKSY